MPVIAENVILTMFLAQLAALRDAIVSCACFQPSTALTRSEQRQLLLPVASPRVSYYRPGVVASPRLLPGVANERRQRWPGGSAHRHGRS